MSENFLDTLQELGAQLDLTKGVVTITNSFGDFMMNLNTAEVRFRPSECATCQERCNTFNPVCIVQVAEGWADGEFSEHQLLLLAKVYAIQQERFDNEIRQQLQLIQKRCIIGRASQNQELPIEEVLHSKSRIRLLRVLITEGELNITALARHAQLNGNSVRHHSQSLVKAGLVDLKRFGRIRIYRFRIENIRARAIKNLFDIWETSKL